MNATFTSATIAQTAADLRRRDLIARQIEAMRSLSYELDECADALADKGDWTPAVQRMWLHVCQVALTVFEDGDAHRELEQIASELRVEDDELARASAFSGRG